MNLQEQMHLQLGNREIKLRLWEKDDQILYEYDSEVFIEHYDDLNFNDLYEILNDKDYIIMQFTGLLDKNGKEIYEGDLVKAMDEKGTRSIYMMPQITEFGFYAEFKELQLKEIIGNIFVDENLIESYSKNNESKKRL